MGLPAVVLGIDFGGTKIATAVCDLSGRQLATAVVASGGALGARASFDRGIAAARDLLARSAPGAELAAVGVATFGIPFEDRVELAPTIAGWEELAMGRLLRAAFPGALIKMATDAKAAAQAEARWGALAGYDPAIYLNLGTGLAAALVIDGKVVGGSNGAAGEIGYNLRSAADLGLPLDQRTPLEDMVSGRALTQLAAGRGLAASSPQEPSPQVSGPNESGRPDSGRPDSGRPDSGPQLTAAEIFAAAADGSAAARGLVTEYLDELAFHLVNLAILVNPARIGVGGGMARSWGQIGPRLEQALRSGAPFAPELVVARFPYDGPLLGAVALAVGALPARDTADGHGPDDPEAEASRVTLNQETMA